MLLALLLIPLPPLPLRCRILSRTAVAFSAAPRFCFSRRSLLSCSPPLQTLTGRDGKISKLDFVYIRGSKIRLVILPDMLKNARQCTPQQRTHDHWSRVQPIERTQRLRAVC